MKTNNKNLKLLMVLIISLSSFKTYSQVNNMYLNDIKNGYLSNEQLNYFLSRSISEQDLILEGLKKYPYGDSNPEYNYYYYLKNINMLPNVGARFIGRVASIWGADWKAVDGSIYNDDNNYFNRAKITVELINKAYRDYNLNLTPENKIAMPIIQAGIFECVTERNDIEIPQYVLTEYGQNNSIRNFDMTNMFYDDTTHSEYLFSATNTYNGINGFGVNGSVPDITKIETQMFFYYLATKFIDMGFESIHFGWMELMSQNKNKNTDMIWYDLSNKIRIFGKHKNRGFCLIDAHTTGIYKTGTKELVFDFHSHPIRMKTESTLNDNDELCNGGLTSISVEPKTITTYDANNQPILVNLDKIYQQSKGGISTFGWETYSLPYIVEFDNYGSINEYVIDHYNIINNNLWFPWGWDEITWFARQNTNFRNDYIKYAYYKIQCIDPNGHLEIAGHRGLDEKYLKTKALKIDYQRSYSATEGTPPADNCEDITHFASYDQEQTIKDLWAGVYDIEGYENEYFDFMSKDPNYFVRDFCISNDNKYIFYRSNTNNIKAYKKDGSSWNQIEILNSPSNVFGDLCIDNDNNIYYFGSNFKINKIWFDNSTNSFSYDQSFLSFQTTADVKSYVRMSYDKNSIFYINSNNRISGIIKNNSGTWTKIITSPNNSNLALAFPVCKNAEVYFYAKSATTPYTWTINRLKLINQVWTEDIIIYGLNGYYNLNIMNNNLYFVGNDLQIHYVDLNYQTALPFINNINYINTGINTDVSKNIILNNLDNSLLFINTDDEIIRLSVNISLPNNLMEYTSIENNINIKNWMNISDDGKLIVYFDQTENEVKGLSYKNINCNNNAVTYYNINNEITNRINNNISDSLINSVDLNIHLYPIPFDNNLNVESNIILNNAMIMIYNVYGELVLKNYINGNKITLNFDKFDSGLYYYKLESNNIIKQGILYKSKL